MSPTSPKLQLSGSNIPFRQSMPVILSLRAIDRPDPWGMGAQ